jgi:hypothetical protein
VLETRGELAKATVLCLLWLVENDTGTRLFQMRMRMRQTLFFLFFSSSFRAAISLSVLPRAVGMALFPQGVCVA